jgi:pimeloyl-ACP methyl ester carboxylesterase
MDEIVSELGGRYIFFERWGVALLTTCAVLTATLGWLAVTRCRRWRQRLLILALCAIPLAGFAATRFVMSYIQPLIAPAGHEVRSVMFPSSDAPLSGHLLMPQGSSRVPAVLFLSGSDVSSYRTNCARLVNEVLTPLFADMGYAMLYFDKRGVGRSGGVWFEADFPQRAEDARAALRFLAAESRIEPARLVVVGHSQGGWIAQMLASDPSPPFRVIPLAGPTVGVWEQSIDDEAGGLVCAGSSEADALKRATEMMGAIREASRTATRGRLRQFAHIAEHRPDGALRGVRAPLLLVFGENDRLVPPERNLSRLREIFDGEPSERVSIVTLPGANHSLRLSERCHSGSQRSLPYSAALAAEIRRFVLANEASGTQHGRELRERGNRIGKLVREVAGDYEAKAPTGSAKSSPDGLG